MYGSYGLIYEDDAALTRLRQATKQIEELSAFEPAFREYLEGLEASRAVLEDVAFSLREFTDKIEFSPSRLAEIENRLADISQLKRKYGGSIENALEHLARSQDRLRSIEHTDEREAELNKELALARALYLELATQLHRERLRAAKKFEKATEQGLSEVAMENAKFEVHISNQSGANADEEEWFSLRGSDRVEFYFSANVGETTKPLARIASGGEASRLMLVLKTVANAAEFPRTIVFDEIDTGIGGRVSEAVGVKLQRLAGTNQVLCVTHQPQIARFADSHLLVEKSVAAGHTRRHLQIGSCSRVEEIARMLPVPKSPTVLAATRATREDVRKGRKLTSEP